MVRLLATIDKVIGFNSDNPIADSFSRERIGAIRRFIGFYYLAIIAPFLAIAREHPHRPETWIAGTIVLAAAMLRFRHWAFPVPPEKSEEVNPIAARLTALVVIVLTLTQAGFYGSLALSYEDNVRTGIIILTIGMVAALTQAEALTGIIFAARVIFLGLLAPLLMIIAYLLPVQYILTVIALLVLVGITFRLAEASHLTQLKLFQAEFEAQEARRRTEIVNGELGEARRVAQTQADTDSLTGLYNRFAFLRDVAERVDAGNSGLLMLIDLDRFKPINDLYGHQAGDLALRYVARRLRRALPADAIIGRLGGDEFGVFMCFGSGQASLQDLMNACDVALARLRRRMLIANSSMTIGASGGAQLVIADEGATLKDVLQDADFALYAAKKARSEKVRLFDCAIHREAQRSKAVETALLALDPERSLSLAYQPIYDLRTGALSCFEALARWEDPELGTISPAEFVPMAEQMGLIEQITFALLRKALAFAGSWPPPCDLSFNLSAAHICSDNAATQIVELVRESGFPADRLQFEITETAMFVNFEAARRNVELLRAAGCQIALDDFGAGYASLVHLREIRFDKVKIDGSLTRAARTADGRSLLRGVIAMIEAMKLEAVAEYVETGKDMASARELGAGYGQGYFLSPPVAEHEALDLLRETMNNDMAARIHGPREPNIVKFGRAG